MNLLIIDHHSITLHAFILIGIGLSVRYLIGRRRFNRRGITGLQLFSSYKQWWLTTRIEAVFNFLALLAILSGIFLLTFQYAFQYLLDVINLISLEYLKNLRFQSILQ